MQLKFLQREKLHAYLPNGIEPRKTGPNLVLVKGGKAYDIRAQWYRNRT